MTDADKSELRFSADRPIESPAQDELEREKFAGGVARAISEWREDESLVLALYGPWGSGKTSVANLVKAHLESSGESIRTTVFQPWQLSSAETLSDVFYRQVGAELGRSESKTTERRIKTLWRLLGNSTGHIRALSERLPKAMAPAVLFSGVLGILVLRLPPTLFVLPAAEIVAPLLLVVFFLCALFGGALSLLETSFRLLEEYYTWKEGSDDQSPADIKKKLRSALSEGTGRVLVIIDDLDRLSEPETQRVIQLVKANADLPRLIYLLPFEREYVEKSLDACTSGRGSEYLKKIVQVGLDIPTPPRHRVVEFWESQMREVLPELFHQSSKEAERGSILIYKAILPYFENLRDVKRFVSGLSFHLGLFRAEVGIEVNPLDLTVLEVLRGFEPGVYRSLPRLRQLLITGRTSLFQSEQGKSRDKSIIEDLLNTSRVATKPLAGQALKGLFPAVALGFPGYSTDSVTEEEAIREQRVCSENHFDRYFHLSVPDSEMSKVELEALVSALENHESLREELLDLHVRGLLGPGLEGLYAHRSRILKDHAAPLLKAMFELGERIPKNLDFLESRSVEGICWDLANVCLRRFEDKAQRLEVFKASVQATGAPYIPVVVLELEAGQRSFPWSHQEPLFAQDGLSSAKTSWVKVIQGLADSGILDSHAQRFYLFAKWREWDNSSAPREWMVGFARKPAGAKDLLTHMGRQIGDTWTFDLEFMTGLVPPNELLAEIEQAVAGSQDEETRDMLAAFRQSVKRLPGEQAVNDGGEDRTERGPTW
ncbi:MAG: P-loop NTPase fold protein [Planctomycetota bacterium]|nr:P-loop NTPase fold protein [Planctomycetota bacterium]